MQVEAPTVLRLLGPTLHELDASKGARTPLNSETLPLVAEELAVARAALERLIEAARLVSGPA